MKKSVQGHKQRKVTELTYRRKPVDSKRGFLTLSGPAPPRGRATLVGKIPQSLHWVRVQLSELWKGQEIYKDVQI